MGEVENIIKAFKKARKQAKLTQEDVANKVGIHPNYYSRLERGEEQPALDTVEAIAKVLKLKITVTRR